MVTGRVVVGSGVHSWLDLVPYEWTESVSNGQAADQHMPCWLQLRTAQN